MKRAHLFRYMLVLSTILTPALGLAGSATSAFRVTATLDPTCTVQTTPAAFGHYNPLTTHASAPLDITSSVTITCSKGMATTIGLDRGLHADYAQGTTRSMKHVSKTEYLSYDLYKDAIHTTLWGTSGTHLVVPPIAPDTTPRTYLIFGRVPAGQDVSLGDYLDTIVAIVNF
jgi:spore coat protein U-like protein